MGDVTLVIDADTARAVRELAKMAQAQGQLEKATKQTAKSSAEADREAARAAREASDSKAKSAKDAADAWRRHLAREKRDIEDAARDVKRIQDQQAKHAKKLAEETTQGFGGLGGVMQKMASGAAAFAASFASISTVLAVAEQIRDRMRGIAEASDSAARAMRSVSIQVPGGDKGRKIIQQVAAMGAKSGMTPEETGQVANVIQSIPGADLAKEMANAGVLNNLGVSSSDIAPVLQTGIVRGMGGAKASDLALRASELAPLDVQTVARYLPKTVKYTSLEAGLAAGTTLKTAGVVDEQIPYAVEALGRALSEDKSPLAKKFKLKGLSESERLARISAAADASGDRAAFIRALPEKYKTGEEEGRSLQMVLSRGGQFASDEAALRGTTTGYAQSKLDFLMTDPNQRAEIEGRKTAAMYRYNEVYGDVGARARNLRAGQQATGVRLQRELPVGVAQAMVDENGMPTNAGLGWAALQKTGGGSGLLGIASGMMSPGGFGATAYNYAESAGYLPWSSKGNEGTEARTKEMTDLTAALMANTEATKANTGATGGETPGLASRRNAGL